MLLKTFFSGGARMKVNARTVNLYIKALVESMDLTMMVTLARRFIKNYDINKRTGFPDSIPVPRRDAANQIVNDIKDSSYFLDFANTLIDIHYNGYMGRPYSIAGLREIVKEIQDQGYIFDKEYKMFVEDPNVRRTRNWGVLRDGEEYLFTFLRYDIVGNSVLVREYQDDVIQKTYSDLQNIVQKSIDKRNGRIWISEGDGGLIAFYFLNKNRFAVLSAIEIINELFIYNYTDCVLGKPLEVRISVHTGLCPYMIDQEAINKNDTVKKIVEIESKHTKPNTVTISNPVYAALDHVLAGGLVQISAGSGNMERMYSYALKLED
jgi:hypothetical protein